MSRVPDRHATDAAGVVRAAVARRRGFTLLELLASVAIFSLLIVMLFQMVKGALDVWALGEQGKESIEKSTAVLDQIASDLRMVHADSPRGTDDAPVRMLSDYVQYDLDSNRDAETVTQRLRFVRALPEERFDPRLRAAGETSGGKIAITEGETALTPALPPGGLAEIIYTTTALPQKRRPSGALPASVTGPIVDDGPLDPARLMLVRGMKTPIAREGSFLAAELTDDPKQLLKQTVVIADGVLFLGFEFWSRDTVAWDAPLDGEGGPLSTWDSTRALMLDKEGLNRFVLAKDVHSLRYGDDDVFPRRIRVTLVIERDADLAYTIRLEGDITPQTDRIRVSPLRLVDPVAQHKFFKIGGEWIEWSEIRGDELLVKRGVRGSDADSHASGTRVHVGETFERTVDIPVFREDWNTR